MIYRPNGARRTRHYVQVVLGRPVIQYARDPWSLFRYVKHRAEVEGVDPARLEWRRCTDSPIGITALFEVV